MIKFTESKLLKWIKNPRPETTLANWLREKRRKQRIKAAEEQENLISDTAYKLWEEDGKPNNNSEYYWFKAIQTKRPIRRFAAWWETTAIEKLLEDVEFLLKNAALLEIVNLVAGITIIISLITWLTGRRERWENEIFSTWNIVKEAEGNQSGVARLAVERLLRNDFSLEGVNLTNTNLQSANLQEARLRGANLQQANLVGANLQQANLGGANLQQANLGGANLQQAYLRDADLQGAYLRGANLQGAALRGADFQKADLRGADFQKANLAGANLQGARLKNADLQGAYLGGANLQGADLLGANLQKARLKNANLQGAELWSADFQEAHLGGANLQGAALRGANLQQANLGGANLQQAYLLGANLQGANLQGAFLRGANLQLAVLVDLVENLTHKQIKNACLWKKAIYKGKWNNEKKTWIAIEPDNTNFIEGLKKDKSSDPKTPVDCKVWGITVQ